VQTQDSTLSLEGQQPRQEELPFALVQGTPLTTPPRDLYIPPDALEVILEAFEGPLDLLLYLIKRQNLDVLDIPIARITDQYMDYIEMMQGMKLELAAEYLLMAAMLAEIKSRMLLPRPPSTAEEEDIRVRNSCAACRSMNVTNVPPRISMPCRDLSASFIGWWSPSKTGKYARCPRP